MRISKKVFAALMAALMVSTVALSGCSTESQSADSSSAIESTVSDTVSSEAEKEEAPYEKDGYTGDEWFLVLVNSKHSISKKFAPDTASVNGTSVTVDSRIVKAVNKMIKACNKEGNNLSSSTAYRDYSFQKLLFDQEVQSNLDKGMSKKKAKEKAATVVAKPGTSEHQTGLALDMVVGDSTSLEESFKNTAEGKWLAKNAWKYGFVIRYPEGKEDITGIIYEPWHLRYVGKKAAKTMHEQNLCLEEYLGLTDEMSGSEENESSSSSASEKSSESASSSENSSSSSSSASSKKTSSSTSSEK